MMKQPTESGKIVKNATWLIACKVVQSLLSFIIGTLSARYLGPGNYGIIDYAAAIVSFMVPVVQLGFRSTLVHEIIAAPDSEGRTLGTSLFMSTAASFLGIFGVIAFTAIANPNDPETMLVCALYSISLVFQATEMLQYWFQAKLLSKYTAVASLAAYVIVSAYRCFLLITQKSVYWFAFSQALDYLLISVSLYGIYRRISKQKLTVSFSLAKQLFKRSRYYIVSGIMVTFFSLTDRVMITLMLGKEANGYYSAAVSCAALSQFVFAAIVDSMRPSILEAKKTGSPQLRSTNSRTLFYYRIFGAATKHCADRSSTTCYSNYLRSRICPGDSYAENHYLVYGIFLYGFRSQYMDPGRAKAEDVMENQFVWSTFECASQLHPDTAYRYQRSGNCFGSSTGLRQFCAVFYGSLLAPCWTVDS